MAITQGIKGTFVPAYEFIDDELSGIRKIKKTMQVDGVWQDVHFVMITDGSSRTNIQRWLQDHYGPSKYCVTWWPTFNSVCMLDKIYTHWKLCE